MTQGVEGRAITLFTEERDGSVRRLVRSLEDLSYRVELAPPRDIAGCRPCGGGRIAHLGSRAWPPDRQRPLAMQDGSRVDLLALERSAFGWARDLAERCPDFLCWPCSPEELKLRLRRDLPGGPPDLSGTRTAELVARFAPLQLLGRAQPFLRSLMAIERFSQCLAPVLIQGETGTGKELAARALHALGARRDARFVSVNCGALPDSLVESELFGHERGAFTDAREPRAGLVVEAAGGTLFLDEIESLSAKGQVALLRFLESREFRPLGGRTRHADVRLIAAGNADLATLVRRGAIRPDLYYRLNVLTVTLPPLRARKGDATLLAEHFVERFSTLYHRPPIILDPATRCWLDSGRWPGNVRELENLVQRSVLTGRSLIQAIENEDVAPSVEDRPLSFNEAKSRTVAAFERRYLTELLRQSNGNVSRAARRAGKERRAFGRLLKKYAITPGDVCEDPIGP